MKIDNKDVLIYKTNNEIIDASISLANKLNVLYKDKKDIVWITIMKGGLPFSLELMKHINFEIKLDFIFSSSYANYKKINTPIIEYTRQEKLNNKNIILIDDVYDSGETFKKANEFLKNFNPKSIFNIALINKSKTLIKEENYFFAFKKTTDNFLVGFGLDFDGHYRNLPFIGYIKK